MPALPTNTVPDFSAMFAEVVKCVLAMGPGTTAIKILATTPNGENVINVPMPVISFKPPETVHEERRAKIIEFMRTQPEGKRVNAREIASGIGDEDQFERVRHALSELASEGILFARQGVSGFSRGPNFPLK